MNETVLIITLHGKERIIAPILEQELGLQPRVISGYDTDKFGTFSGEKERVQGPKETAIAKIAGAQEIHPEFHWYLASEGSFFPSPLIPFTTANVETIVLLNAKEGTIITGNAYHPSAPCYRTEIESSLELENFLSKISFPENGLILSVENPSGRKIRVVKDIAGKDDALREWKNLKEEFVRPVIAETDMRANRNSWRMDFIADAMKNLVANFNSRCPACKERGFQPVKSVGGLPCGQCGFPTRGIVADEWVCERCQYSEKRNREGVPVYQDPMYCDHCNP